MSSEHKYGSEVDVDEIRSVLSPTRQLRLALDVLSGELPPEMETSATRDALSEIHERICAAELKALRIFGLNLQYTIIRPLNMMSLPDPEGMQKIASAIQTLADFGLIAGPGDV
jgi:hypothetical protein